MERKSGFIEGFVLFLEEERMSTKEGFGCWGCLVTVGGKDISVLPCGVSVRCCGSEEGKMNAAASQKSAPKVLSLISFPPHSDTVCTEKALRSAQQPARCRSVQPRPGPARQKQRQTSNFLHGLEQAPGFSYIFIAAEPQALCTEISALGCGFLRLGPYQVQALLQLGTRTGVGPPAGLQAQHHTRGQTPWWVRDSFRGFTLYYTWHF